MKFNAFALACVVGLFSWPALAAKDSAVPMRPDIAAVVGQEIISTYDVDNRVGFIIASGKLPETQEVKAKIRPQIIRTLIDEKLQIIDAEKNDIKISDDEVNQAIVGLEKDRKIPEGAIFALLARHHLPKETFTSQIRAQLAWRKLVVKKLRMMVRVNDEEVRLARLAPALGMPQEIKIAVLSLPVDKKGQEKGVENTAKKLAKELRGGASFEEVTRQLSGRAASNAGEAFWVRPEQLDSQLARALAGVAAGSISDPVRTPTGYVIVKVHEVRLREGEAAKDSEVTLKEILLKLKKSAPQEEADALFAIAQEVTKHPGTCEEKGIAGIDSLKDVDIEVSQKREMTSELPQGVRQIVSSLKLGEVSTPFESGEGIRLYMLCERKEQPASEAEIERLKNQIYQQKIELEAQKYLRNLRRDTFIEVR